VAGEVVPVHYDTASKGGGVKRVPLKRRESKRLALMNPKGEER